MLRLSNDPIICLTSLCFPYKSQILGNDRAVALPVDSEANIPFLSAHNCSISMRKRSYTDAYRMVTIL